jgi:hypothetical protein
MMLKGTNLPYNIPGSIQKLQKEIAIAKKNK